VVARAPLPASAPEWLLVLEAVHEEPRKQGTTEVPFALIARREVVSQKGGGSGNKEMAACQRCSKWSWCSDVDC